MATPFACLGLPLAPEANWADRALHETNGARSEQDRAGRPFARHRSLITRHLTYEEARHEALIEAEWNREWLLKPSIGSSDIHGRFDRQKTSRIHPLDKSSENPTEPVKMFYIGARESYGRWTTKRSWRDGDDA